MTDDKKLKEDEIEEELDITQDEPEVEIVEEEKADIIDDDEDEEGYKVRMKPELSASEKSALNLRRHKKKAEPKFRRQEWFRYKRLGTKWRKARGLHSKSRTNRRYRVDMPNPGFRGPKAVRGKHPSGFEDVLVHNIKELEALDPKTQAARIGHTVGTRKRVAIERRAKELDIRVLNRGG